MKSIWIKLPIELVNLILEYNGSIKLRNGKYMNQISKTDSRYSPLMEIPAKELFFNWGSGTYVHVLFSNITYRLTMTEYYNCLRFIFYKHALSVEETRLVVFWYPCSHTRLNTVCTLCGFQCSNATFLLNQLMRMQTPQVIKHSST